MLMLCAVVGGLLCLTGFLFLVVHPLVCIFLCALSKDLSSGQKAMWIVATFFTGLFGSLAFAFVGGGSPWFKSISLTGIKIGVANFAIAVCVFAGTPEVRKFLSDPLGELTIEAISDDAALESHVAVETDSFEQTPGQHYVHATTGTSESNSELSTDELPADDVDFFGLTTEASDSDLPADDVDFLGLVTEQANNATEPVERNSEPTVSILESKPVAPPAAPKAASSPLQVQAEITREPAKSVTRETKPSKLVMPAKPAIAKPINRYRAEGNHVHEVAIPQTPIVRNRYTNQQ